MKYSDPYLTGVALGLVLLAAFVVTGHGLGASGAFAAGATAAASAVAPGYTAGNAYFARYLAGPGGAMDSWLVWEIGGVILGGLLSSIVAGRWRAGVEAAPGRRGIRIGAAFCGGAAMGLGAVLARGCTSGQALSGGAMLSVGSWAFTACAFAAAFAAAPVARKTWPS